MSLITKQLKLSNTLSKRGVFQFLNFRGLSSGLMSVFNRVNAEIWMYLHTSTEKLSCQQILLKLQLVQNSAA